MQTPQFQLRRLKKQLAVERENRDELEVELAENRRLIAEKGQLLTGHPGARGGGGTSSGFGDFVVILAPLSLCSCTVHPDRPQVNTACGFWIFVLSRADRAAWGLLPLPPCWAKGTLPINPDQSVKQKSSLMGAKTAPMLF